MLAGADPARVHWVHVHPPCVRVHVHSVLNARSTLNVKATESRIHSQYYKTEYRVHPECYTTETRVHPLTLNFKRQRLECILNVKL